MVFEVSSQYGCFKKFYTNSSILTYDFPPKTSLIGLIGSILGFKRNSDKIKELSGVKIGISILNPINKIHQGINWLNTKVKNISIDPLTLNYLEPIRNLSGTHFYGFIGINKNKPSNLQLLKEPRFLIFISDENFEAYDSLVNSIKHHYYHYSPYLGQSEFLCSINYRDNIEAEYMECNINSKKIPIDSVIPQDCILKNEDKIEINISENSSIMVDQLPLEYDNNITRFHRIVYDKSGSKIYVLVKKYYKISSSSLDEDYNIVLF